MKILLNCPLPFALAHGGMQTQIEQTLAALISIGAEAEPLRWWDDRQRGDLIHYFGVAPLDHIRHAQDKGIPVVMTNLFTEACNRTDDRLRRQGWLVRTLLNMPFGEGIKQQLAWRSFGCCAANIVGLEAERRVLELVYGIPREKVDLVPLGLEKIFLEAGPGKREGDYLLCVGTITRRKNSVALARLARAAQAPILFVGKPYAETEPYWQEFRGLVDGRWVRHQPHVADPAAMVALLQSARGAVVMSEFENWCLTAHEAAACGVPVLLPDQNWSRERFGNQAHYFERVGFSPRNVEILKQFYTAAPGLPAPVIQLFSWDDAARRLKIIYERVLKTAG
jgi:glycosyltransferase involved in cell wall biosynthesis